MSQNRSRHMFSHMFLTLYFAVLLRVEPIAMSDKSALLEREKERKKRRRKRKGLEEQVQCRVGLRALSVRPSYTGHLASPSQHASLLFTTIAPCLSPALQHPLTTVQQRYHLGNNYSTSPSSSLRHTGWLGDSWRWGWVGCILRTQCVFHSSCGPFPLPRMVLCHKPSILL